MLAINDALGTRKAKAAARLAFLFGQKGLKVRNLSIGDMYQLQGEAFIHVWPLPPRFEYANITTELNWYQATIERAHTLEV